MKKINPLSLKGKDQLNRVKSLMNEVTQKGIEKLSKIELVKKGPDNKTWAIIRENSTYFIKNTDKQDNIIIEDFKYMGGLKNKTDDSYKSYSEALKQLNLKFISINEDIRHSEKLNSFVSDDVNIVDETIVEDYSYPSFDKYLDRFEEIENAIKKKV